jgi:hypothetical protein
MMKGLMEVSESPYNGFFLDEVEKLSERVEKAKTWREGKVLLMGVSHALWDLAEKVSTKSSGGYSDGNWGNEGPTQRNNPFTIA